MVFKKTVVVDGRDHLLGRLASKIAKEVLSGQHVVIVRCEEITVSGSIFRNYNKFTDFLRKRKNTNPKKGPLHLRSPAKVFWRTVRGMLPHKTPRGAAALHRLKVFEGVPPPYDKVKRLVVPEALRVLRLQPGHDYIHMKELMSKFGWKQSAVVRKLEDKRRVRSKAYYDRKKALDKLRAKAHTNVQSKLGDVNPILHAYGY